MSRPVSPDPNLLQDPDPTIVGSRRRMTIYYNTPAEQDTGLPLDRIGSIDIADPIKNNYVKYLHEQTVLAGNGIPIADGANTITFEEAIDPEQPQYLSKDEVLNISRIPNVNKNFYVTPTPFDFRNVDKKGINQTNIPSTRTFEVKNYIRNININPGEHEELINRQLLESVGYNENNQFLLTTGQNATPDKNLKLGTYFYKSKGSYATGSYVRGVAETNKNNLSIEHLQKIGINILYDAVQAGAGPDIDPSNGDDGFSEAEAGMAVPSLTRIGKKVRLSRFSPSYEAKKLFGVEKPNNPSFIDNEYGENPTMTYGNVNNPYSQFDSLVSVGQVAVCIAMVISFVTILETTSFFIPNNTESPLGFSSIEDKKTLLGTSTIPNIPAYPSSGMTAGEFAQQFLGIKGLFTYTYHSFDDCLQYGLEEFFGIPGLLDSGGTGTAFATGALKILTENGRMNVILRNIIRNGLDLISNTSLNGGPYSIDAVGSFIKKIRDSKILSFINTLAQIGDKVCWERKYSSDAPNAVESNVSFVDSLPGEKRPFTIAKSRLSNGRLAWSTANSPMLNLPLTSLYVLGSDGEPNILLGNNNDDISFNNISILNASLLNSSLNSEIKTITENSLGQRGKFPLTNRLSKVLVEKMEEQLEADYMPFYIQDLRTNEIMSFHAFLEESSDDFSVELSAQEGFGRLDKVQIYKGATRKINVSFKMVATSDQDHDLMWYKVNRLAMSIYPQWTQGREVKVGGIKFIQPFSQIPGATPVIRLRLGDLWRSNYSKQSICRLFGITTLEGFNVFGSNVNQAEQQERQRNTENYEIKVDKLGRAMNLPNGRFGTPELLTANIINPDNIFTENRTKIYFNASNFAMNSRLTAGFVRPPNIGAFPVDQQRGSRQNNQAPRAEGPWAFASNQLIEAIYLGLETNNDNVKVKIKFTKILNSPIDQIGITLIAKPGRSFETTLNMDEFKSCLDLNPTIRSLRTEQENNQTNSTNTNSGLQDLNPATFFNNTQNPILKSFDSTYGKGLAGVVNAFKIDYSEAKGSWETNGFARAPKFVTITLGMDVIHDIPLGLDANGIMNAPIWPVGNMSRTIGGIKEPTNTLNDRTNLEDSAGLLGRMQQPIINRR